MRIALFILIYCNMLLLAKCCLSNPRKQCSVASYHYSAACRAQFDYQSQQPQQNQYAVAATNNGQYSGFLGDQVHARAYSERGGNSDFAKSDADLQCRSTLDCSWRNVEEDDLDWVLGEGSVDPMKLGLITGSAVLPDSSFFIMASDPRPPHNAGLLVSVPIGCQQSTGILSFRYWRSRARTFGNEPDLDICTRKALETRLENCVTMQPTENHTIIASIPPMLEPFEIVIRGFGFENEPEGGIILLDQIDYIAAVDRPENCVSKPIEETELEPISSDIEPMSDLTLERQIISGDTDDPIAETSLVSNEVKPVKAKDVITYVKEDTVTVDSSVIASQDIEENNCKVLNCFNENSTCDYKRVGDGSEGTGFYSGWKVATIGNNKANRLTGIHEAPDNITDAKFLVADFPGFRSGRSQERFVLESPEYLIKNGPDAYIGFKKYLSTQGIELMICEDPTGTRCFWDVFEHSNDPFARKWTSEVVQLPANITKFFIIGRQDIDSKANVGQLGLTSLGLYADSDAILPYC